MNEPCADAVCVDRTEYDRLIAERDSLVRERETWQDAYRELKEECDSLRQRVAACGGMRRKVEGAIGDLKCIVDALCGIGEGCLAGDVADVATELSAALSSSAGREMLERLRKAEGLLHDLHPGNYGSPGPCDECKRDGQTGSYHENCVFHEVCCAIDAYLKEAEQNA